MPRWLPAISMSFTFFRRLPCWQLYQATTPSLRLYSEVVDTIGGLRSLAPMASLIELPSPLNMRINQPTLV